MSLDFGLSLGDPTLPGGSLVQGWGRVQFPDQQRALGLGVLPPTSKVAET